MKPFKCQCGNAIYFENTQCVNCGRALGFEHSSRELLSLDKTGDGVLQAQGGSRYRYCLNQQLYANCNWLIDHDGPRELCLSCGLNEVIPDLDSADNLVLWTKVEKAKRRLLYSLLSQGLPPTYDDGASISFRLLEDRNRNPNVSEFFVAIGHHKGTITINIAEADDATRHTIREQMSETYRTVLGHLRHESGHFYFNQLTTDKNLLEECRQFFGDEREDYHAGLERYYQNGPPANWGQSFISAYATSHPAEDFAETFAHYLHIVDALESAAASGLSSEAGPGWLDQWAGLSLAINEISRSLGLDDVYPFYLSPGVRDKLNLLRRLISQHQPHQPGAVPTG